MSDYNSVQQVADYLQVSIHTVRGWIKQGKLSFVKAGARTLITREAVQAFITK